MTPPPPLPSAPKAPSPRLASVLNFSLPGAGLYYLGWRKTGAALGLAFIGCFVTAIILFLTGYARYLRLAMSDHLLEGDNLEQAGRAVPGVPLLALALAGAAIYLCSTLLLRAAQRKLVASSPAR